MGSDQVHEPDAARVCFIVAVGCNTEFNLVRSETLGWPATLDAARERVLGWTFDWTEAGYYTHLLLFDPGAREVVWYRAEKPEGWICKRGHPPIPLAPCDAPAWWDLGNPGETYLVNVASAAEERSHLRYWKDRAEAQLARLVRAGRGLRDAAVLASVQAAAVRAWLGEHGWTLAAERGERGDPGDWSAQEWRWQEGDGRTVLVTGASWGDHARRVREAAETVAKAHGLGEAEVLAAWLPEKPEKPENEP